MINNEQRAIVTAARRLPEAAAKKLGIIILNYDAESGVVVFGTKEQNEFTKPNCHKANEYVKATKIKLQKLGDQYNQLFRIAYPKADEQDEFDSDGPIQPSSPPKNENDREKQKRESLAENQRLSLIELEALQKRDPNQVISDMRNASQYITTDFAYSRDVSPIRFDEKSKILYVSARRDTAELTNLVHHEARCHVVLVPRSQKDIRNDQKTTYNVGAEIRQTEASTMLDEILNEAIRGRSSDVLIEPLGDTNYGQVRFYIDGSYALSRPYGRFDWQSAERVINIIREQGEVSPNDTRKPGDGRISKNLQGRINNLRINILPCFGSKQRVNLRFLNTTTNLRSIADLGMRADMQAVFARCSRRPGGFMTIAGPTGSGKTTLAYAIIKEFSDLVRQNVCSIENPIECLIPGLGQIQVDADSNTADKTGQMTIADVLRSLLRQNPDKVFLGEIRDDETLREAMRAATTGCSLLSTIHTDNAIKTISRLEILGANRLSIGQSLTAATSQRLIEMLCPDCKIPDDRQPSSKIIEIANAYGVSMKNRQIYSASPIGCDTCQRTSYRGRVAAFEILEITPEIQGAIEHKEGIAEITRVAVKDGYRPMVVSAVESFLDGLTSEDRILYRLQYEDALRYQTEAKEYTSKRVRPVETHINNEPDDYNESGDDDVLKF